MKNINDRLKMVGVVVLAVLFIAGAASISAFTFEGTTDEWKNLGGSGELDFGGITNYDSLTLGDDLVVGGTSTFGSTSTGVDFVAVDGINYTDMNPDMCAIQWIDCDETATTTTTSNPCEYTNATGVNQFVTDVGLVITSGSASEYAYLNVDYGTTATESASEAKIFWEADLGFGYGANGNLKTNNATDSASGFDAFILADGDSIFATQTDDAYDAPYDDDQDMGNLEESILSIWFRWCEVPSGFADADLDS